MNDDPGQPLPTLAIKLRAETAEAELAAILVDLTKLAQDDRMIIRIAGMIEDVIERYRPTEEGDDQ